MKPVGLDRSAHRPRAVRRRAAAAGQPRRRSLQPRRLSDADQMGRAGARAAADSRARAGRVRALRHGAPQHVRQRPDGARRDVAGARAADAVLRRPDVGRRRLRRVGGLGADGRDATRPRSRTGEPVSRAAADDGDRRAGATTCRTPTRRTTSRRTSRSGSWSRSTQAPRGKMARASWRMADARARGARRLDARERSSVPRRARRR